MVGRHRDHERDVADHEVADPVLGAHDHVVEHDRRPATGPVAQVVEPPALTATTGAPSATREAALAAVVELGARAVQGYYFGQPIPWPEG